MLRAVADWHRLGFDAMPDLALAGARRSAVVAFCGLFRLRGQSCPAGGASSVGVPDYSPEAFSGGRQVVFELFDAALGGVGLSCAGVAFGEELAVRGFQRGDPCD